MTTHLRRLLLTFAAACAALAAAASVATAASKPLKVTWIQGDQVPGTPAKYNKVGILKIGPASAKNVMVFTPGTQAGSAYIVPLAQWLTKTVKGWQVWSIERRENLFEDQSMLNLAKEHKATAQQVYNYYFAYLTNPGIKHHFVAVPNSQAEFAKSWGTAVAVNDMHHVVEAAKKLGGKVVLMGHSLGGALTTAYATWNFGGKPGAADLAGLVFDDGAASKGTPATTSAAKAEAALQAVNSPSASPWLNAGVPAPYLGLFGSAGALAAIQEPNAPSIAIQTGLLKSVGLAPPVPTTNLATFAWNTNVATSKLVFAFQAHIGEGLATTPVNGWYGWNGAGALTPAERWAAMLAGPNVQNADGIEWYFPNRLAQEGLYTDAINNGNANPAGQVFGLKSTLGHHLPKRLLMYAFGAVGYTTITDATAQLAAQSGIPSRNLTLVSRYGGPHGTYAHNDPAGAYPKNAFFDYLVKFLHKVVAQGQTKHRHAAPPKQGLG